MVFFSFSFAGLPSGQVDKVHLGNSLRWHVAFREAGLYEGYRKNRVTPATHVVHLCAGCGPVRITSHHALLEQEQSLVGSIYDTNTLAICALYTCTRHLFY